MRGRTFRFFIENYIIFQEVHMKSIDADTLMDIYISTGRVDKNLVDPPGGSQYNYDILNQP